MSFGSVVSSCPEHNRRGIVLAVPYLYDRIRNFCMTTLNLGHLDLPSGDRRGSFGCSGSARISQPPLVCKIRQLEQFLQTRLVERTGRGIKSYTCRTGSAAPRRRIQQAVDEAVRSVSEFSHDVSGTVTLALAQRPVSIFYAIVAAVTRRLPLLKVG